MASFVVTPKHGKQIIVRCKKCDALYVPDLSIHPHGNPNYFESCPCCGESRNTFEETVSLGLYNLIKFFRGQWRNEDKDEKSKKSDRYIVECQDCVYWGKKNNCKKLGIAETSPEFFCAYGDIHG